MNLTTKEEDGRIVWYWGDYTLGWLRWSNSYKAWRIMLADRIDRIGGSFSGYCSCHDLVSAQRTAQAEISRRINAEVYR